MQIPLQLVDTTLPVPAYKTAGAAGFDFYARVTTVVPPRQIALIPLNVIIQLPPGHFLLVASRSSLPIKKGLTAANGLGVIDQDYSGPTDEIHFIAYNLTDVPVTVERGERIAQGLILPVVHAELAVTETNTNTSRGGFGSTGT